jgi:ABC-type antimicrobial peptide transport system permease subunit
MSFTTGQRTREFGVRIAPGAARRDIVTLVLREGLTVVGVIAGVAVALPLTGLLRTLLFGVTATDPLTFLFVSLAIVVVAVAASYVPARRALKVDRCRHFVRTEAGKVPGGSREEFRGERHRKS